MKKASLARLVMSAALPLLGLMVLPRSAAGSVKILSWSNSKTNNQDTAFPVKKGEKITFSVQAEGAQEYRWWVNKELQEDVNGKSFTWTAPNDKGMWKIHVTVTNKAQEQDMQEIISVVKGTKEAQENWDRSKISPWCWGRWPWMLDAIYPSKAQKEWTVSAFVKEVKPGESIQAAVDSVPAEGGIVLLSAGTHKVAQGGTARLTRHRNWGRKDWTRINKDHWTKEVARDYGVLVSGRKNIVIKGAGMDKTTVINTTDRHTYHLFFLVNASDITIKDMFITSRSQWPARSNDPGSAVSLWTCRDITVAGVKVEKLWKGVNSHIGFGLYERTRTDRVILSDCVFSRVLAGHDWFWTRNCIVKDCESSHCTMFGFSYNGVSSNQVVARCRCHHNGNAGILTYTNRNFVVTNNLCYANNTHGIQSMCGTPDVWIRNNVCRDNRHDGIQISTLSTMGANDNTIASGNVVFSNGGVGVYIVCHKGMRGGGKKKPSRVGVESNTIFSNKGGGICAKNVPYKITVRNNIIANNGGHGLSRGGAELIMSYNNVWKNAGGAYKNCEKGAGDISANPVFADPSKGDFHLKSKAGRWGPKAKKWVKDNMHSPCIDAGDPKGEYKSEPEPNGNRINIGAYGNTNEASKSTERREK